MLENLAIVTQDSVVNTTIFAPPQQTTALQEPNVFHYRSGNFCTLYGTVATTCVYLLRKVPNGYAVPSISLSTGVNNFVDVDNIIGYCIVHATTSTGPEPVPLQVLKRSIKVNPGDSIILQAVSNATSASQVGFGMLQYSITG
jgi:hypothetical protein